jgi:hypothetical protein
LPFPLPLPCLSSISSSPHDTSSAEIMLSNIPGTLLPDIPSRHRVQGAVEFAQLVSTLTASCQSKGNRRLINPPCSPGWLLCCSLEPQESRAYRKRADPDIDDLDTTQQRQQSGKAKVQVNTNRRGWKDTQRLDSQLLSGAACWIGDGLKAHAECSGPLNGETS